MSIDDFTSYMLKVRYPYQRAELSKTSLVNPVGRLSSLWINTNLNASAPTTAAIPTNATTGSFGQKDSSGVQRLMQSGQGSQSFNQIIICDRLSHQGGLSGTAVGAQTTNLPTAALTRYTSGEQVFLGIEIYSDIGATPRTVAASYTNQAGVSGRTTQPAVIGGTDFLEAGRILVLNLQAGDTGVRAVASVTLSASTGTVGNFGVTLFRPLWLQGTQQEDDCDALFGIGFVPEIVNGACLFSLVNPQNSQGTGSIEKEFTFAEDS